MSRAPRSPWERLGMGTRAQRVGGERLAFNASPVPAHAAAVAEALAGTSAGSGDAAPLWQDDVFTLAGGVEDVTLTYLPLEGSEDVKLKGLGQERDVDWSRDEQTLSVLAPMDARAGQILTVHYQYLDGVPTRAEGETVVLFTWNFDDPPTTTGSPAWSVANGSYYLSSGQRNGAGDGVGWQSDGHAHKTVTAQTGKLAAGVAVQSASGTSPTTTGDDTDADDFGLFSFCPSAAGAPLFYLGWDPTFAYLRLYSGQRGTTLATSAVRMTDSPGAWDYVEMEVKLGASGYARVWLNGALVIDHAADLSGTASLDTVKMGGFIPNLSTDDLYIATGRLGDPGDVTDLVIG